MHDFSEIVYVTDKSELGAHYLPELLTSVASGLSESEIKGMLEKFRHEVGAKGWRQDALRADHPLVLRETHLRRVKANPDQDREELQIIGWNLIAWSMRAYFEENTALPVAPFIALCRSGIHHDISICPICRNVIVYYSLVGLNKFDPLIAGLATLGLTYNPRANSPQMQAQVRQLTVTKENGIAASKGHGALLESDRVVFLNTAANLGNSMSDRTIRVEISDPPLETGKVLDRIREILSGSDEDEPGGRYALINLPTDLPDDMKMDDGCCGTRSTIQTYGEGDLATGPVGRGWFPIDLERSEDNQDARKTPRLRYAEVFIFQKPDREANADAPSAANQSIFARLFARPRNGEVS